MLWPRTRMSVINYLFRVINVSHTPCGLWLFLLSQNNLNKYVIIWFVGVCVFLDCFFLGLDFRWCLVPHLAGRWCMDVHGINIKSVCHISGSLCGGYKAGYLSQHYVYKKGQISNCRHMGIIVCHLFSTFGGVERSKGRWCYI